MGRTKPHSTPLSVPNGPDLNTQSNFLPMFLLLPPKNSAKQSKFSIIFFEKTPFYWAIQRPFCNRVQSEKFSLTESDQWKARHLEFN
ncbi:hypothetical protein SAMN06265222_104208 [Neorhodopirellula lusitana]|uniref:Uncharacterized protein n=1 Tax=Neorhodopirellula lusitana TaxID=445327 RepID=A0ABY1PZG1_9BACT|nr:hypothetical protein SAMN06265222_104208 [Neorhodopirellula lusitana]